MADTNFRGPVNSMGALEVNAATAAVQPLDGPSMFYQGVALPDPRTAPFAKDGFRSGQQRAFSGGPDMVIIDQIPQARTTTALSAAQIQTAGTVVTLTSVQPAGVGSAAGLAVGVPIIPLGTSVATYANIALDFGFTNGSTVANSSTVHTIDSRQFRIGQWLVIGGVGNTAATRSLIAQVRSINTTNLTGITISPVALTTIVSAPIGQGNLFGDGNIAIGTQFGPATASASAHSFGGSVEAGLARIVNPREMLARNIMMNLNSAGVQTALIVGWDIWGAPMTEVIIAATQTTIGGDKAFKYLSHITLGSTNAQTGSFGLGDTFGLPVRADYWEQIYASWNGTTMTTPSGFAAALTTTSATSTIDVRGLLQISSAILTGALASSMSVVASNGTGRLFAKISLNAWQVAFTNPLDTTPMFGTAQGTATS